jgi:hypothetical protein
MNRQSPPPFLEKEKGPPIAQFVVDGADLWWTFKAHNARLRAKTDTFERETQQTRLAGGEGGIRTSGIVQDLQGEIVRGTGSLFGLIITVRVDRDFFAAGSARFAGQAGPRLPHCFAPNEWLRGAKRAMCVWRVRSFERARTTRTKG